jgi:two-component system CheB/CheR fusion protein
MAASPKLAPLKSIQNFFIVGIGASAGGLDAFKKFLKAIPPRSGMAFVLVQHLDPNHESLLPEILSKITTIPVNEVTDDIHLAPNNIYVIPENKTLTSEDGVLKLTPRKKLKTNYLIDVFFTSLAEIHKKNAVGVVLSGLGNDGTLGLKEIKARGGITFAQELKSATHDSMPRSAIETQVVDFILIPEKMPGKLVQLKKNNLADKGTPRKLPMNDESAFNQILYIIHQRSGVDFIHYKKTTLHRRIERRLIINKIEKLTDYLLFIRTNKAEQDLLFQDLLIPVTSFFRDEEIFRSLKDNILPILLKNKPPKETIRVWSAGCSTGEEAYSLAICLSEFLGENIGGRQIQIFASDISEKAIITARRAIFNKANLKRFSDIQLKTYFTKNVDGYQLIKSIRDICVFTIHNFVKDPPFSKMDLVSCRNVLIYMEPFLQKKALTNFHYALNKKGYLLLGKSETTAIVPELFSPSSKNIKIYSPNPVKDRSIYITSEQLPEVSNRKKLEISKSQLPQTDFRKCAESILLSKHTPCNVIINEQFDIVHIHGAIESFTEPSQGKPSHNLIKIAREGLAFELRNNIHKAKISNSTIIKEGIIIKSHGKLIEVDIEITPIPNTMDPYYLVLFKKREVPEVISSHGNNKGQFNSDSKERIHQLEKELSQIREDMRLLAEDQDAANEELQSANEEFLSGNEELQSLNEELESSKEELQSINEELIVVNQELTDKNEQLDTSFIYTEAIIATLREPLLVLDKSLRIKTANDAFHKKFNILEPDISGALIYDINNSMFDNTALYSILEKNLRQYVQLNDYEIIINIPPYGDCNMLLNARKIINKKSQQLILLSFEDITERKEIEKKKEEFSENLVEKVKEKTLKITQTNLQLEQFTHTTSHEFQEPLRKIITLANLLQKSDNKISPEQVKEYLNKIEGASIRMRDLIKDMLNFATINQNERLFIKTDLNLILKNILYDFELLIAEKKAKVISHKLPIIEAIPFQMNQLFYDLIHNALKFSKLGVPPEIDISSRKVSKDELKKYPNLNQKLHYHEVAFKDNGIGFDQKYALKIFTMFQRLVTDGTYAGTGIGLALCSKIAEENSGQIFAEGKENNGATFYIMLPTHQPVNKKPDSGNM